MNKPNNIKYFRLYSAALGIAEVITKNSLEPHQFYNCDKSCKVGWGKMIRGAR